MVNFSTIGNTEILQIIEAVAREKGIQRDAVIEAMEQAVQVAGRRKYGHEHNIHAVIDRKTGEIKLSRQLEIVEKVEDFFKEISLQDALEKDPNTELGGFIYDPLPPIDLGRVAAQTAKQVIVHKIRDAEREKQYEDFKDRVGEIANGVIKRIEYGDIIVDLGRAEAILKRDSIIRNENFRQNDRIRAYIEDVRRENKGPQIFLSRTSNQFLAKLFAQEVPEIYDNVIEIKAVSREPGSRAKIAVYSNDSSIDAVGSCVGIRGSRVQAIINELQGEKIDIISWSPEPATFIVNALAPAEVTKVVIDEEKKRIEVVVPGDQLSLAIGRRGQNVRLASRLTGWNIDVLTEDDESKRRVEEFNSVSQLLMQALNLEEVLANLLAAEGFSNVEEIAYISLNELASIEGFDENLAQELQQRAKNYLELQQSQLDDKIKSLQIDPRLEKLIDNIDILLKLADNNIKTLEDFADLSSDEFFDIIPDMKLLPKVVDSMIMNARSQTMNNSNS
jgi:N utilization substance protein A